MDRIKKLEREIEELRKLLTSKEKELCELKRVTFLQQQASIITQQTDGEFHQYDVNVAKSQYGDKLPKWAIERCRCQTPVYPAAPDVDEIGILDYGNVELTNVHQQVLHGEGDQDTSKAESTVYTLRRSSTINNIPTTSKETVVNVLNKITPPKLIKDCPNAVTKKNQDEPSYLTDSDYNTDFDTQTSFNSSIDVTETDLIDFLTDTSDVSDPNAPKPNRNIGIELLNSDIDELEKMCSQMSVEKSRSIHDGNLQFETILTTEATASDYSNNKIIEIDDEPVITYPKFKRACPEPTTAGYRLVEKPMSLQTTLSNYTFEPMTTKKFSQVPPTQLTDSVNQPDNKYQNSNINELLNNSIISEPNTCIYQPVATEPKELDIDNKKKSYINKLLHSKNEISNPLMYYYLENFYEPDPKNKHESVLIMKTIKKDRKVYNKKRIITSETDRENFTVGPDFEEKQKSLPQMMIKLKDKKARLDKERNLKKRLILGSGTIQNNYTRSSPSNISSTRPDLLQSVL